MRSDNLETKQIEALHNFGGEKMGIKRSNQLQCYTLNGNHCIILEKIQSVAMLSPACLTQLSRFYVKIYLVSKYITSVQFSR